MDKETWMKEMAEELRGRLGAEYHLEPENRGNEAVIKILKEGDLSGIALNLSMCKPEPVEIMELFSQMPEDKKIRLFVLKDRLPMLFCSRQPVGLRNMPEFAGYVKIGYIRIKCMFFTSISKGK